MRVSFRLLVVTAALVGLDPIAASSDNGPNDKPNVRTRGDAEPGPCGGGKVGNKRCSIAGQCCSKWGYCGTDDHHCKHLASDQDGDEDIAPRGWFDCWHVFDCSDSTDDKATPPPTTKAPADAEDFNSDKLAPVAPGEIGAGSTPNPAFRWSCTGGGWRAMFAAVGFVNLFQQAGLMGDNSSQFGAIATNSGATWFSTQLFYSEAFYKQTVMAASPDDLADFTVQWMNSYLTLLEKKLDGKGPASLDDLTNTSALRKHDTTEPGSESTFDFVDQTWALVTVFDGQWAQVISDMIGSAAADYGQANFSNIVANAENRVTPLQHTDLLIQTSLSPTARPKDTVTYLGPAASTDIYSVAISTYYTVNGSFTGFQYGTEPSNQFETYAGAKQKEDWLGNYDFDFSSWKSFDMFKSYGGGPGGTVTIPMPPTVGSGSISTTMPLPFAGATDPAATVIQVASASSAAAGGASPAIPSVFAQVFSVYRPHGGFGVEEGGFDEAVSVLYEKRVVDGLAVCSQWPNTCGFSDGWFLDGQYVDNAAFAIDIAQYHKSNQDLSATLKIVLTNTNCGAFNTSYVTSGILQFFSTDFNEGVEPGGLVWPPGFQIPSRSPRCFNESMDRDTLAAAQLPLEGSNMTYSTLTGTTIDNTPLGIRAGQTVEILLINLNSPITTFITTPTVVKENTVPMADMTKDIASNQQLKTIIEEFFFGGSNGDNSTTTAAGNDNSTTTAAESASATTSDGTPSPPGSNDKNSSGTGE